MKVFSFSRLSLYETCPHRFYRKYVEGYEEPSSLPLALGKGIHKAIEDKMNSAPHNEAVINGLIEAEFHPEVSMDELSKLTWNAPIQGKNKIAGETEIYFKIPLSDERNAPMIQGYIDVVGNRFIVDWKSNRVPYEVRKNHQIGLYAWAMSKLRNMPEVYGTLYFLRFRKGSSFKYTKKEMEESRLWALNLSKEIQGKLSMVQSIPDLKDDLFPDKPSTYCSHCPFAANCFRQFSPYSTYKKKMPVQTCFYCESNTPTMELHEQPCCKSCSGG